MMIEKYFVKQAFRKIDLERFFEKNFARAGFNSLSIVRTPISTKLVVSVAKPGIAIGYSGKTIKSIGRKVEEEFEIKNPHIEIKGIDDSNYNVKYIVQNMIRDLERGTNWKQVALRVVRNLSDLPIMGFELILKGKMMAKAGRKQKYRFVSGYLKVVGNQTNLVRSAMGTAYTRSGAIGIRLKLVPPNVTFPDKIGEEDIEKAIEKLDRDAEEKNKGSADEKDVKKDSSKEVGKKLKAEKKEESGTKTEKNVKKSINGEGKKDIEKKKVEGATKEKGSKKAKKSKDVVNEGDKPVVKGSKEKKKVVKVTKKDSRVKMSEESVERETVKKE